MLFLSTRGAGGVMWIKYVDKYWSCLYYHWYTRKIFIMLMMGLIKTCLIYSVIIFRYNIHMSRNSYIGAHDNVGNVDCWVFTHPKYAWSIQHTMLYLFVVVLQMLPVWVWPDECYHAPRSLQWIKTHHVSASHTDNQSINQTKHIQEISQTWVQGCGSGMIYSGSWLEPHPT